MSADVIERVARAICVTEDGDPDAPVQAGGMEWPAWQGFEAAAKAALEAAGIERLVEALERISDLRSSAFYSVSASPGRQLANARRIAGAALLAHRGDGK